MRSPIRTADVSTIRLGATLLAGALALLPACGSGGASSASGATPSPSSPPTEIPDPVPVTPTNPVPTPTPPTDFQPIVENYVVEVVLAASGMPVRGARIELGENGDAFRGTTGADGRVTVPELRADTYAIRISQLPRHLDLAGAPATIRVGVLRPRSLRIEARIDLSPDGVLLFGNSDSTEHPPYFSRLDTMLSGRAELEAFLGIPVEVVNLAIGNTPAAPGFSNASAAGVEVVAGSVHRFPGRTLALVRYGRNDIHYYLQDVSPAHRELFESSYRRIIDTLLDADDLPVLYTLVLEGDPRRDAGIAAANAILTRLAREYDLPLVVADFGARTDPDFFYEDHIHIGDRGHARLADLTVDELMAYFTGE